MRIYAILKNLVPQRHRLVLKWKLFNKKINRDQWDAKNGDMWKNHRALMELSWEELILKYPDYMKRVNFSVNHCQGRVLEIGCGIGNMTRWISNRKAVSVIMATDLFEAAIIEIKKYKIPKVTSFRMGAEELDFPKGTLFDTVVLCEILEHLYPDEEMRMLGSIKQHIHPKTSFIISTPIGWLSDPYHTRGFSKQELIKHVQKHYGKPIEIDYASGYSQSIFGYFKK